MLLKVCSDVVSWSEQFRDRSNLEMLEAITKQKTPISFVYSSGWVRFWARVIRVRVSSSNSSSSSSSEEESRVHTTITKEGTFNIIYILIIITHFYSLGLSCY